MTVQDPRAVETPAPEEDVEMGFLDHLGELRTRLIRALWGLVPGVALAWVFKERLLDLLLEPFLDAWRKLGLGEPSIHFANPIDPFVAYLKLALVAGALSAAPWIFWQLWGFISPGLYKREKRLAVPFALVSTVCFVGGAFFGYAVVFPLGFETFLSYSGLLPSESVRIQPTIMIGEYLSFATRMLLAFGVVFEIPVIITFMAAAGIVDWRQLLRFSKWWILVATLIAAMLTPPDVGSQLLMLGPLILLYFVSVGLAWIFGFRRKKAETAADEEAAAKGEDPYER
ncbi:MAG: twin-arginine translocase subunit TatC [Myxococcota bacterium]